MDLCFILLGPPGAGKGTQGLRLAEILNAHFFSTGDLLRAAVITKSALDRQLGSILTAGGVAPTDLLLPILEEMVASISDHRPLLFDFAGTTEQCVALDEILASHGRAIYAAFLIEVPSGELRARLLARGRDDDKPGLIEERLAIYEREIIPVRTYYETRGLLRVIDGSGTPAEVSERLLVQIEGFKEQAL